MSFEYIVEKENKTIKLSEEECKNLAQSIRVDFETYNAGRTENLNKAKTLIDEIFFRTDLKKEKDKNKKWKMKVKMCKTFMYYQTLKAFIWKNVYSNMNSMFDVSGENQEADSASNKQKAMLVDIFEKMEYQKTIDKIIDYALFYGELISYTAWKKKEEEYRRPIDFFKQLYAQDLTKLPKIIDAMTKGKKYYIDTREVYNNPYIYDVNPADLVFDVTQADNWDCCPKIYKTWKTTDEILNNKLYRVSKADATAIKELVKSRKVDSGEQSDQTDDRLIDETVNGQTIEVLEHWGDLRLPNGTVLKNYHAVSVVGKYLVRFSKNEMTINPFTHGNLLKDPQTGRGLSPLISVLELAKTQEGLMNKTYDMQTLNENPPLFAPEGFFEEDEVELYPGKIIEFDPSMENPNSIKPMQFTSNIFLSDVAFLSDLMSEVSGIFPNMLGSAEEKAKTATEINVKSQGQSTRLSMILDIIYQYLIVPDVKNVAKLCAGFKSGIETLFINKDNKKEVIEIDDAIRQADYKYTYADRSAIAERVDIATQTVTAIREFAQYLPIDAKELFIWFMEQKGVENPERFIKQVDEIPIEVQQLLIQDPKVQMLIKGFEEQKTQLDGNKQAQTQPATPTTAGF